MRMLMLFTLFTCLSAGAQQIKRPYTIIVTDNYNMQFLLNEYRITQDSLVITALNDKGVTRIDYLKRKLTGKEKKSLKSFFRTFNTDSLQNEYFSDFNNLKFIDYSHYPKLINVVLTAPYLSKKIKVTNCFVYRISDLINMINPLFPPEVRIKYNKDDFDKTY